MLLTAPQLPMNALTGTVPLPMNRRAETPEQLDARATKAAKDFESYFVSSMLESMTAGVKTNKMFGGGSGEDMFRSMLNQEYGKAIAQRGSLGVAPMIKSAILKLQESAGS